MSLYPLQIFSRTKDDHQDVPLYDFPEEDGMEIHHAERTLHLSSNAISFLSLSPFCPVKCCISGLTYKEKELSRSPYFILFIMDSTNHLPSHCAFINRRVITSHVPEYFMFKNVLHSDVSKARISFEDVPCFSPAKSIAFTVYDVHERDPAVNSMKLSMRHRIKDSFPLTSPFLFQSKDEFKTKIGFHDYVMSVASVSRNEAGPYFCLQEQSIISRENMMLKSYSRSEQYSDPNPRKLYYFVDEETSVEFSFPSTFQAVKPEFPFCYYCPYADGIVNRLSSLIVKLMKNKIKFDNDSYGVGSCGLIAVGEKDCLKREIVAKSVKEAKFNLVEWDLRICKDDNWLKTLVTKALQKTPSVILVSCGDLFFTEEHESGREAVSFITEELLKSVKEEVLLIVTSEHPHNVSTKLKNIFAQSFYVQTPTNCERREIVKKILEDREDTLNSITEEFVDEVSDKTRKLSVREMCSGVLKEYGEHFNTSQSIRDIKPSS